MRMRATLVEEKSAASIFDARVTRIMSLPRSGTMPTGEQIKEVQGIPSRPVWGPVTDKDTSQTGPRHHNHANQLILEHNRPAALVQSASAQGVDVSKPTRGRSKV